MKTQKILSLVLAMALIFSVGCLSAFADELPNSDEPLVYDKVTATLDLSTLKEADEEKVVFEANGCDGAILAKNGANLTINGKDEDIVRGLVCPDDGYSMAVWAKGKGTVVTINGGNYTNAADPNNASQADMIYASDGAKVVINGGTFECITPQWTLNCKDNSGSTIIVKGGRFFDFNPELAQTGEGEIIVPEGYTVKDKGDGWYEVVGNAKVFAGEVEELTLSGDLIADGEDGAIQAKNGAQLTIKGTENDHVVATYVTEYTMAVWAQGENTLVTIEGGYYTNEADPNNASQADLIYASGNANIVINGGTFVCVTPQWTLNCNDNSTGTITVNGGKFWKYDPSNAQVGEGEIVLGEDCTVVKNGDWYEVKVAEEKASITYDSTSAVKNDTEGALRFVFNVSIPTPTKTYFGAYLLPLDIFKASGVAKAVQVQYDTEIETKTSFSADLVKIPADKCGTDIYAIPYIKTANGVETFTGKSASVNSALAQ